MIDFRYHIVSLIAVFLALAVGVVLGAGPLQGGIGDQLQVQIEELRQEREELRVQAEESQAANTRMSTFIDATAERLVVGSLEDVDVAVVQLPGADSDVVTATLDRIAQAGGDIAGHVALSPAWTDPGEAAARDAAAAEVIAELVAPPAGDVPSARVLGAALGQALVERDALAPGSSSATAQTLYDLLLAADLLEEVETRSAPADAVLVVAPASSPDRGEDGPEALELEVQTVTGFSGRGAVLAGTDVDATDLVDAVRADADAAAALSTVDGVDVATGRLLVPLALANAAAGTAVGHYGLAEGATAVLPPVVEPPADADSETDGGDGGQGEEEATP